MKYKFETMEQYEKRIKGNSRLYTFNFFLYLITGICFIMFSTLLKQIIFVFGLILPFMVAILFLAIVSDMEEELKIEKERRFKEK